MKSAIRRKLRLAQVLAPLVSAQNSLPFDSANCMIVAAIDSSSREALKYSCISFSERLAEPVEGGGLE